MKARSIIPFVTSLFRFSPSRRMFHALELRQAGHEMEAANLIRSVSAGEEWRTPNQRQRRKNRRRLHAAGDRRAFN